MSNTQKRIAVIGCSHSAYDQVFHSKFPDSGIDWVHYMANKYPHIQFDNYGIIGTGPLYYDMVLKSIINNKGADWYDAIIVQFTVSGRWFIPLNINNMHDIDCDLQHDIFAEQQITDNYSVYRCTTDTKGAMVMITRHGSYVVSVDPLPVKEEIEKMVDQVRANAMENTTQIGIYNENMFVKSLDTVYSKVFQNVFYFDFLNGYVPAHAYKSETKRSNIGHELPFLVWAEKTYGEDFIVSEMVDDSLHCTRKGNEILFDEYLKNSAIGSYLDEIS